MYIKLLSDNNTLCNAKMKASPLLISWHNDNTPIYSAHFEPHGKGRLATAGGDNNVRIWKVERDGEERTVTYLTTLIKVGISIDYITAGLIVW